jgi:hypothetical protein
VDGWRKCDHSALGKKRFHWWVEFGHPVSTGRWLHYLSGADNNKYDWALPISRFGLLLRGNIAINEPVFWFVTGWLTSRRFPVLFAQYAGPCLERDCSSYTPVNEDVYLQVHRPLWLVERAIEQRQSFGRPKHIVTAVLL